MAGPLRGLPVACTAQPCGPGHCAQRLGQVEKRVLPPVHRAERPCRAAALRPGGQPRVGRDAAGKNGSARPPSMDCSSAGARTPCDSGSLRWCLRDRRAVRPGAAPASGPAGYGGVRCGSGSSGRPRACGRWHRYRAGAARSHGPGSTPRYRGCERCRPPAVPSQGARGAASWCPGGATYSAAMNCVVSAGLKLSSLTKTITRPPPGRAGPRPCLPGCRWRRRPASRDRPPSLGRGRVAAGHEGGQGQRVAAAAGVDAVEAHGKARARAVAAFQHQQVVGPSSRISLMPFICGPQGMRRAWPPHRAGRRAGAGGGRWRGPAR